MSSGGSGGRSADAPVVGTGQGLDAAVAPANGQDEAICKALQALDQIGSEASIASQVLNECEDFEGTAYHLRRIHAHLKFVSGVLVDLRKRKT